MGTTIAWLLSGGGHKLKRRALFTISPGRAGATYASCVRHQIYKRSDMCVIVSTGSYKGGLTAVRCTTAELPYCVGVSQAVRSSLRTRERDSAPTARHRRRWLRRETTLRRRGLRVGRTRSIAATCERRSRRRVGLPQTQCSCVLGVRCPEVERAQLVY